MHTVDITGPLAADFEIVRTVAREVEIGVWLVGGPVRDALLGREVSDLDFLVEERVERMADAVSRKLGGSVRTYPEFMTAKVLHPTGRTIDFTAARQEEYPRPGALPVVREASVETDLRRRDFTINSIAYDVVSSKLLDPTGGLDDLEHRLIRILHPASFLDDPTRMFRALRFASRLSFEIERQTETRLHEALAKHALTTVSPERLWREFTFCLREPDPASALALLARHEILQTWLGARSVDPALHGRLSLLSELCCERDGLDEQVLYLAALCEGMGEATAPGGTGFSRRRLELLDRLVVGSEKRLEQWSSLRTPEDRARFCLDLRDEEVIFLAVRVERPHEMAAMCRELHSLQLPFDGDDLGVPPGPHIGKALRDARVGVWLGTTPFETSLEFARRSALRYLNEGQS